MFELRSAFQKCWRLAPALLTAMAVATVVAPFSSAAAATTTADNCCCKAMVETPPPSNPTCTTSCGASRVCTFGGLLQGSVSSATCHEEPTKKCTRETVNYDPPKWKCEEDPNPCMYTPPGGGAQVAGVRCRWVPSGQYYPTNPYIGNCKAGSDTCQASNVLPCNSPNGGAWD